MAFYIDYRLNDAPSVTLSSPANNQTLTEGSTYTIAGTASDPDSGNAVTVKYSINGGTARNITSAISDGATPIPFSKVLTFRNGRLYDGNTDVSGQLAENTTYTVSVYAVDDQGGTSPSYTRSFKVILNRPPNITLNPYNANQTGLSVLETLVFTGKVTDPENDNVNLTVSFNGGDPVTLKSGVPSGTTFEYKVPVSALANGSNTVVFTATDTKGAEKKKTLTFAKSGTQAPVNTAVTRYSITPPLGSTAEIVAWVNREIGDLNVDAAFSIVGSDANESYKAMTKNASVPVGDGTVTEDEFVGTAGTAGPKVTLRLTLTRANSTSDKAVKKIMGGIG
ncbi:Ig-like domain-containing protein [Brevibacillus borstelensis]|uniref:Ig-like domain-containing protein n=1 Tax=Brevibacillus borstelensis TaxID=45462 RepID=UPI00287FB6FF|nr:Ig-like domain-containing protein [Brevibacillus borstelensis]WNF07489.1 Ig-like domain-containing protein [Brevibacillus borstelensis]